VRGLRGLPGVWPNQQGPKKHLALRKDKQVFYRATALYQRPMGLCRTAARLTMSASNSVCVCHVLPSLPGIVCRVRTRKGIQAQEQVNATLLPCGC
jgi:hypothetical protein